MIPVRYVDFPALLGDLIERGYYTNAGLARELNYSERGLLDTVDLPVCENGTAGGSMRRWLDCAGLGVLLIDLSARHQFALESVEAAMERPIPMPSLPAQTIATQFDTVGGAACWLRGRSR